MVKRKVKDSATLEQRGKKGPGIPERELLTDQSRVKLQAEWASVIADLRGQKFQSISDAEDAVIVAVIERLNVPSERREHFKGFLKLVFSSDPGLQAELQNGLDIAPIKD